MKNKLLRIAAVVMALSFFAGCSPKSAEIAAKPNEQQSAQPEEKKEDKEAESTEKKHVKNLIIGTVAENNVFNSQTQKDAFGRMNYNGLTQGNFVYRDKNNVLQPYFFKSFEISEDGKKITFTFPLDAVWHDGKPVTSEDILFTFDYMKNVKKTGSLKNLEAVNLLGEDSAELIFSEPDAYYWINSSAMNNACVFPKHIWEGITDYAEYAEDAAAIGCGPYKLVSKDKDAQISYYEAVPENNYAGEITVDAVTLKSYSGEDTLMMAMLNGEIDAMFNYANPIDATLIETLSKDSNIDLGESDYAGNFQLTYGMERPAGADSNFRHAVRYALDYNQLAITINGEFGQAPGSGIIPPSTKGFDASLPMLSQDLDKANALLDEGGYKDVDGDGYREFPDGSKMEILVTPQYSASTQELLNRIADVIMASVDKVGIKTVIDEESLANSEIWEKNITDGKYDLSIGYTTSGMAAYSTAFRYFLAEAREGETTWIWGTYNNPEFKDTFFNMQQATSDDVYIENVKKLQKMASDEAFAQALCWEKAFFPYRTDKYEGFDNYPSWGVIHSRTWFELTEK
ncbi:ABC transporter substrate-binding protein [Anaeropeptidivorans aminofermentans]|uniref:ABC transporter substrate-binding protein n=1 Tax=Anaeropeptidivorans aminofermentans TaxID=2934315 RepID=UPI002024D413|nr:ABC transporter substrate-binding protein [Anaeropeptidivorans aminofermentans]